MKKNLKKVIAIAVIFACLCSIKTVYAHEIFYDSNGNGIVLKWANLQNGVPYLTINGDYLSSDYSSFLDSVIQAWPSASSRVGATAESFLDSKVDFCTPTTEYWENRFGWFYASYYYGITDLKNSTGIYINTVAEAEYSSRDIVYAQIYINPDSSVFENNTHREKTMVHELGHVLCLGHPDDVYDVLPDNVTSIMRRGSLGYKTPQSHDITDLSNKY